MWLYRYSCSVVGGLESATFFELETGEMMFSDLLMSVAFLRSQRMLLHDLYETKMCNSMLFPESDEDIWKHEDVQISVSPLGVHISKGDSKGRIRPNI